MFRLISRPDPAPQEFTVTAGEAMVYGQCVKFANGVLTAAATTDAVAGVTLHAVPAGIAETCKIIFVDPEQVWEADMVGVADAGFIVGLAVGELDATGAFVNAAKANPNGACAIIKIDSGAGKCWVKFKKRQLT